VLELRSAVWNQRPWLLIGETTARWRTQTRALCLLDPRYFIFIWNLLNYNKQLLLTWQLTILVHYVYALLLFIDYSVGKVKAVIRNSLLSFNSPFVMVYNIIVIITVIVVFRVFTNMYLNQTMFLGHTVLQQFCIYRYYCPCWAFCTTIGTIRSMCALPSMAVLFSYFMPFFPGMLFR
jgi:phage-related holin